MVTWSTHLMKYGNCQVPTVKVSISGKSWSSKSVIITQVDTNVSVNSEASTCSVEFATTEYNYKKGKLSLDSDISKIKLGVKIEVSMGFFVGKKAVVEKVFSGFVCDIEFYVSNGKAAHIIVRGMDAKMWMMPTRKIELKKEKKKISAVVQDTLKSFSGKLSGTTVKIDSEPTLERLILQNNESDYDFLCRLAKLSGCFFYISLGKLYFTSVSQLQSDGLSISPDALVYEVDANTSVWGQPKTVEYSSLEPNDSKKVVESKVTSSNITKYGSGKASSGLTSNISGAINVIDYGISSKAEAKFRSEAIYNSLAINLSKTRMTVAGIPDISVASALKIKGYGNPIDNTYIITRIKHHYGPRAGEGSVSIYTTEIEGSANKINPFSSVGF